MCHNILSVKREAMDEQEGLVDLLHRLMLKTFCQPFPPPKQNKTHNFGGINKIEIVFKPHIGFAFAKVNPANEIFTKLKPNLCSSSLILGMDFQQILRQLDTPFQYCSQCYCSCVGPRILQRDGR